MLAGLEIGMVLAGHFPIGLLDLVIGRGSFDAESFVVVAFGHGCYLLGDDSTANDRVPCVTRNSVVRVLLL